MDKSLTASEVYNIILAPIKKEKERLRMAFTEKQLQVLEDLFAKKRYPSPTMIYALSEDLCVTENQLRQWFAHRRRKKNADDSKPTAASLAKLAKKSNAASVAAQEKKSDAALIATQERQSNVAAAAVNKENASHNYSVKKGEVHENRVQEKIVIWNPEKGRCVMQQMIRQYKGLSPPQLVEAHYGRSDAVRKNEKSTPQKSHGGPRVCQKSDLSSFDPEVLRMFHAIQYMISEYRGLSPTRLIEAHFGKLNHNNNTGNRTVQADDKACLDLSRKS